MISWEQHHRLCERGSLSALLKLIDAEADPLEKDILYISSINMTYSVQPEVCLTLGKRYIDEFRQRENPFGPNRLPDSEVLKKIVKLLTFELPAEAIEVCKFAIEHGVTNDGTKGGFAGRIAKLQKNLLSC